jgi:hypothetical protein
MLTKGVTVAGRFEQSKENSSPAASDSDASSKLLSEAGQYFDPKTCLPTQKERDYEASYEGHAYLGIGYNGPSFFGSSGTMAGSAARQEMAARAAHMTEECKQQRDK